MKKKATRKNANAPKTPRKTRQGGKATSPRPGPNPRSNVRQVDPETGLIAPRRNG